MRGSRKRLTRSLSELSGALCMPGPSLKPEYATVTFDRRIARVTRRRIAFRDFLLPGFIDLHVNGAFGIDVMAASAEDLLCLSHCLAHEGTTAWMPTVITSPLDTIERCDAVIGEAMAAQRESERASRRGAADAVGATILGMHLEGPFISPRRLGAHPPMNLLPQGDGLERILTLKSLRLITLAPELPGALDAIPRLVARGVTVSIGHTDADYETAVAGLQAGARMFTHLFNAMPPFHHRAPGPVGAAARELGPIVTLIPDGVHVHSATLRLCRGLQVAFVTDRVAFAGADESPGTLFGRPCDGASQDGRVVRLADGTLAGSTITMRDAAIMMARDLGGGMQGVEQVTALNPAYALQIRDRGRIYPKCRADLILLDPQLNLKAVFIGGQELD
jgi:N-acetylglucosamine-6-phosphate deacetylase